MSEGQRKVAYRPSYSGPAQVTGGPGTGKTVTVLHHLDGCGHNGLALTKQKTFLLACTNDPGAILELDLTGMPVIVVSYS